MACGDDVVFMSVSDGAVLGRCHAGGALKAAPVCDPWTGAVWAVSHGRRLTVCEPPGVRSGAAASYGQPHTLLMAMQAWTVRACFKALGLSAAMSALRCACEQCCGSFSGQISSRAA